MVIQNMGIRQREYFIYSGVPKSQSNSHSESATQALHSFLTFFHLVHIAGTPINPFQDSNYNALTPHTPTTPAALISHLDAQVRSSKKGW